MPAPETDVIANPFRSHLPLVTQLDDETRTYRQVLWIRASVEPRLKTLLKDVRAKDRHEAMARAVGILQSVLKTFCKTLDMNNADAGHGAGHVVADYLNALRLFSRLDLDPKEILIGFLGGVLHDLGCAIMKRYQETDHAVRHAEMGGLLADDALRAKDLNEAERLLTVYAIMAHTHYLKPSLVGMGKPASERRTADERQDPIHCIVPYVDLLPDGAPFTPVWCTRWVDRLDCNGPRLPARHYLTLAEDHEDLTGLSFSFLKFDEQMKPLQQSQAGHPTLLSHLYLYHNTQNNHSSYGEWDSSPMADLRDRYSEHLYRICRAVEDGKSVSQPNEETVLRCWTNFLGDNAEPTPKGRAVAVALEERFRRLPDPQRIPWLAGFWQTLREYKVWSNRLTQELQDLIDLKDLEEDWLKLAIPGVSDGSDVRELIRPFPTWTVP
jgi:hypothetical protein